MVLIPKNGIIPFVLITGPSTTSYQKPTSPLFIHPYLTLTAFRRSLFINCPTQKARIQLTYGHKTPKTEEKREHF